MPLLLRVFGGSRGGVEGLVSEGGGTAGRGLRTAAATWPRSAALLKETLRH